jgi:hypothetical protein
MLAHGIQAIIRKNSSPDPCTTYGLVGYGYVSVQARRRAPYLRGEHGNSSKPDDEHDLGTE